MITGARFWLSSRIIEGPQDCLWTLKSPKRKVKNTGVLSCFMLSVWSLSVQIITFGFFFQKSFFFFFQERIWSPPGPTLSVRLPKDFYQISWFPSRDNPRRGWYPFPERVDRSSEDIRSAIEFFTSEIHGFFVFIKNDPMVSFPVKTTIVSVLYRMRKLNPYPSIHYHFSKF